MDFIFYKIVDYHPATQKYGIQCINTKAIFYASIHDIIFDIDILHSLHPIQACYIGIEYAKSHRKNPLLSFSISSHYPTCRYGIYKLRCQDREGNIEFVNQKSQKSHWMDPRDIALSEELIQEFDAQQAFHIGIFAGIKMNMTVSEETEKYLKYKKPSLVRVK